MKTTITIWKLEDQNTRPRGFGNPPTYHIDKPYASDWEMIWATPIECILPDGYTISESNSGTREIYDPDNAHCQIYDYYDRPYIVGVDGKYICLIAD